MEKEFKRVGTHSGRFHADEVMSTAILKELFDFQIVRSRNPEILKELDLVYDVGDGEFDHHQLEKKYRKNGIPYAACGLIWDKFGRDVIRSGDQLLSEEDIEYIFYRIDAKVIKGIDAADNGLKTCMTIIPTMNIPSIITEFNPPWNSDMHEDTAFDDAVNFASTIFENMLKYQFSVVKAKNKVVEAYNNRIKPELLLLEKSYPWNRIIYEIDTKNEILFVIYPKDNEYVIQTVKQNGEKHGNRKSLPLAWAGKRDGELSQIIGVEDAIFCHTSRFIASAKSKQSILKMAELALAEPEYVKEKGFLDSLKKFLLVSPIKIKR